MALTATPLAGDGGIDPNEILADIAATLAALGCCHEKHGRDAGSTPPMFYAEWIRCVVARREQEIRRLQNILIAFPQTTGQSAGPPKSLAGPAARPAPPINRGEGD